LERRVRADPAFEIFPSPVELASVCFRYLPGWARRLSPGARARQPARGRLNRAQKEIQQVVERQGFAWFPTIILRRAVYFRFGIFNYRTSDRDVAAVLARIRRIGASFG